MPDARLRQLERRWLETGAPVDGAPLEQALARAFADPVDRVRERLRLGLLDPARLQLACYLEHPVSAELLRQGGEPPPPTEPELEAWAQGLAYWGKPVAVRAAAAAARATLPLWTAGQPDEPRPARAVAAADAWLDCPCEAHAALALEAAQAVWLLGDAQARADDPAALTAWQRAWPTDAGSGMAEAIASATGSAAYTARAGSAAAGGWAENAAISAAEALGAHRLGAFPAGAPDAVWQHARLRGADAVRAAVRDELGGWALLGP